MKEAEYLAFDGMRAGDEMDEAVRAITKSEVVQFRPSRNFEDAMWAAGQCGLLAPQIEGRDRYGFYSYRQAFLIQGNGYWAIYLWRAEWHIETIVGNAPRITSGALWISTDESGPVAICRAILKLMSPQ